MGKLRKHKLYLMAGVPGSGKSTWIKNHINGFENAKVVSRDAIRFNLLGEDDDYFSKENFVWNEFVSKIKYYLSSYDVENVFADATHISRGSRTKLLNALGSTLKGVEVNIICMDIPLKTCLAQNAKREGRSNVPENVIKGAFKSYTIPTLEEGFNEIITYSKDNDEIKYTITKRGD